MTIGVAVALLGVRVPLGAARIRQAATTVLRAEHVPAALLSITFVSRSRIAMINREHFGRRGPTDVIAFGLGGIGRGPIIGDVYIAPDVARANAVRHRIGVREELLRLVVHGILHVLGHDHPDGAARHRSRMWARQEALVRKVVIAPARK